jgi:hypothetical protein
LVKRSPTDSSGHKFTVDGNSVKNQKQNYFKNSSSTLTTFKILGLYRYFFYQALLSNAK